MIPKEDLPGAKEIALIEDLANRTLAVDDETNVRAGGEFDEAMPELLMAMRFRGQSPRIVLQLIDKLRDTQRALLLLAESDTKQPDTE